MDKKAYEEKVRRQEEAEIARIKALSDAVSCKVETNRITKPDSPYRRASLYPIPLQEHKWRVLMRGK